MSAYGGVIALNRPVGLELAEALHENFVEVLIAPDYEDGALEVLQQKEAIRILCEEERRQPDPDRARRQKVLGGLLIQDRDGDPEPRELMEVVTKTQPSEEQWRDMLFAWTVVRHVRSNAIVIAKDGATLGIGAGQMSRVDSVRLAVEKCRDVPTTACSPARRSRRTPSSPSPTPGGDRGRPTVIQPGGSKRDACDSGEVAMVFTKHRHLLADGPARLAIHGRRRDAGMVIQPGGSRTRRRASSSRLATPRRRGGDLRMGSFRRPSTATSGTTPRRRAGRGPATL